LYHRNKDGNPEFDFDTDAEDIRLPEIRTEDMQGKWRRDYRQRRDSNNVPEMEFSLRVSERTRERETANRARNFLIFMACGTLLQCECKCVCVCVCVCV